MEVKILLKNGQKALGDALMMTPLVRDLKKTYPDYEIMVDSGRPEIFENNPHITIFPENEATLKIQLGPGIVTQGSKTNGLHLCESHRVTFEKKTNIKVNQTFIKPDIYLTQREKNNIPVKGQYWVICTDHGAGFTSKKWSNKYWQNIIDNQPQITFVQIGLSKFNNIILKGDNVVNLIDQTNIRGLFILIYNSMGVVSLLSAPMHIAAAFNKPCVVIAGAREPVTFEQYQNHRFLHNIGTIPCAKDVACWSDSIEGCKVKFLQKSNKKEFYKKNHNADQVIAPCMSVIYPVNVCNAIQSYYKGGVLKYTPILKTIDKINPQFKADVKWNKIEFPDIKVKQEKIFKIVSNGRYLGGAERSVREIIFMAQSKGYKVELVTRYDERLREFSEIPNVKHTREITTPCDILMLYASDMVFDFHKPEFDVFNYVNAKRKIMALTYKMGKTGIVDWSKNWDKYIFLSTEMANTYPDNQENNIVLAPPVNIDSLLKINPYLTMDEKFTFVRHSSQGDKKYSKDISIITDVFCNSHLFNFMPGPKFLPLVRNVLKYNYNELSIDEFLSYGHCFLYLTPEGYTDQGPRVIVEAMAAGLPVIATNSSGAKDRVTDNTGWLVNNHNEVIDIITDLTKEMLVEKGIKAKQRARIEFNKERWIDEIIGI